MKKRYITFDEARPIIEARLYAYAVLRREYPDAPLSSLHSRLGTGIQASDTTSRQENWATRHASEIRDGIIIEQVMASLPEQERRLVEMRYLEFARWGYVCKELSIGRTTAYLLRDRALMAFAHAFELLATA